MAKAEARQAIFRVLSDLIKSDNMITVDELDGLDDACERFRITGEDKEAGFKMTLSSAARILAQQSESLKRKVTSAMEDISMKDGECCRAESIMITAMEYVSQDPSARILSMEFRNRPLLGTQLLYIENRKTIPGRTVLDTRFDEVSQIVKMGGLELIYIPRVAQHFRMYSRKGGNSLGDLKRVLRLVSPQSDDSDLENTITAIQGMNTRFFFNNILNGRLDMGLALENPAWIIRMPNSVVDGKGYANFLCFDVKDDIVSQLREFVQRLNSRQSSYSIVVNDGKGSERNFLYNGFYKALLDVMSVKRIDKWDLHIRLYGNGAVSPFEYEDERTGTRKKCVMTIRRGLEEFPVPLTGRDVAFYLLLLCASAADGRGIDFHDEAMAKVTQRRYEMLYQSVSKRDDMPPMVWIPESRFPMKSRIVKVINESEIARHSSLQEIYLPKDERMGAMSIPLEPERVFIDDSETSSKPLKESSIYRRFLQTV